MNGEQRNLIFGLAMGFILTVNVYGLLFYTDLTTLWGIIITIGRAVVVFLMTIVLTLFFVSED